MTLRDTAATLADTPLFAGMAGGTALEHLNPEQVDAVTHGEGPLLVVAGAGTGKTQVITRRIGWLIGTGRARPEEILALTFTDKAAAEMETRVDQLVPLGSTGATISTFHAFCDRFLRQHAIELGITSQMRVESEAETLVFLREHLFELGLERYLPLGAPEAHLRSLLHLFNRARDHDVSPAEYVAFADELAATADTDRIRRDRAAAEVEKARAYAKFDGLLLRHGRIDFGSQIGLALRLLRERPALLSDLNDTFRYVLVDEFQDTNHVQLELVKLLAGPARNLAVVGDDDQSIYRFRGAKAENLVAFLDTYPDARVVVLRRNYRSGQRVLDTAHRLIQFNNPARLEAKDPERFGKRLIAERAIASDVEHRTYDTASDEADAVAEEIAAEIASGRRKPRDVAILARTHRHLDPFAIALRAQGIRFQRGSTKGLYERAEVCLCLDVLRTIADPDDGASTYRALGHPLFGVDAVDLAKLSARARHSNRGLIAVAGKALDDPELQETTRQALRRFLDLHARLCELAIGRRTAEVLYAFVTESGLLGQLSRENSPEAVEKVQNINKLFGITTRVGPLLHTDRVPQFIVHLDLLIEAGDDPQAAVLDADEDAVQLLTAHNAKGLEFPVVYVVQLAEYRFPGGFRNEAMELPSELRRGSVDPRRDHEHEERRLFYVAMTRARDRLVLTNALDYRTGFKRPSRLSRFVGEALALPAAPAALQSPSAFESIARFAPVPDVRAPEASPLAPDQLLRLSHLQIDDYITCPLKYRFAHVVQIPLQSDPRFMYGRAIHHAIQVFLQHRMKGLPIGIEDVVQVFERDWSPNHFHSLEHEKRRLEEGRATLERFVAREQASATTPLAIEREFKFRIGNDVVVGRWDRVDERGEGIVLVDYKTAEIEDAAKAFERAKEDALNGQLGLYALAYQEMNQVVPARAELHFVGSGLVGSMAVSRLHLERARDRIRRAAAGIRDARFHPEPDLRKCGDCPYSGFCSFSAARHGG